MLTLTLSEDDEQFDDKIDILELAGLGQSATFSLVPGRDPSTELLGFLRLMNVSGMSQSPCWLAKRCLVYCLSSEGKTGCFMSHIRVFTHTLLWVHSASECLN